MSPESSHRAFFAHEMALVETSRVGDRTRVWAFAHLLPGAVVGSDCNICDHVFIEGRVVIGDSVTVKSGVQLWDGVTIGDNVFIGPNATFTNDPFPRSRAHDRPLVHTYVEKGASIGANATILPGVRVGTNAMVGAGSVVTCDVPPNAIVMGSPARITGYVDAEAQVDSVNSVVAGRGVEGDMGLRGVRVIEAPTHGDLRGSLVAMEFAELPFHPVRSFTVFGVPSKEVRGAHAHRVCEQLLTCVAGSLKVAWDDGQSRGEVALDSPNCSLYLPSLVWAMQYRFSAEAVLLVHASLPYDPLDYIRTYDEFLGARSPS